MKKFLSLALGTAMTLGATSCLNNGEPDNILTESIDMYNFVVSEDGEEPTFSQSLSNFVFDFNKRNVTANVRVAGGDVKTSFNTEALDLKEGVYSYVFSSKPIVTMGQSITSLEGNYLPNAYNPQYDILKMTYVVNDSYKVYSNSLFFYNFVRTRSFTQTVDDLQFKDEIEDVLFRFDFDCDKKLAGLIIYNFCKSPGSMRVNLHYTDFPYKITSDGHIVIETVESSANKESSTGYDISKFSATIDVVENEAEMAFTLDDKVYKVIGHLFAPIGNN